MKYREATISDVKEISTIHAESWRRTYRGMFRDEFLDSDILSDRINAWTERLTNKNENFYVVVAEDKGSLVGFACVMGNQDPRWGSLLDNIHVIHSHKGLGIGTELLRAAINWADSHFGEIGFYLWVLELNELAQQFYYSLDATNQESAVIPAPGGGKNVNFRFTWRYPREVKFKS